jgi:hypothetical protein
MNTFTLIALGLLAAVGFMWRELRRAPLLPPGHDADGQPMKDWRTGVKQNPNANDGFNSATGARLLVKLPREEKTQRSLEGRN